MGAPSPTTIVREELVRVRAGRACDRRAELAGLLRGSGTLHLTGGGRSGLEASSEHAGVARRIYSGLVDALGARGEVRLLEPGRGHPRQRYAVHADDVSLQRVVEAGILGEGGAPGAPIQRRIVAKRCCAGAYLRGAFLARGSLSDPRRGAHLEIRADTRTAADGIAGLMDRLGAPARVRAHRGAWAAYLKSGVAIGAVLAAIGAHDAYLAWEAGAVWRSVHERASRLANADAANARRVARAAADQLATIRVIEDGRGLASLPRALREAAALRTMHPGSSIDELGRSCEPPVSKAAFAGRLRRLRAVAEAGSKPVRAAR